MCCHNQWMSDTALYHRHFIISNSTQSLFIHSLCNRTKHYLTSKMLRQNKLILCISAVSTVMMMLILLFQNQILGDSNELDPFTRTNPIKHITRNTTIPRVIIVQNDDRLHDTTGMKETDWLNFRKYQYPDHSAEVNRRYAEKWGYRHHAIRTNEKRLSLKPEIMSAVVNETEQDDDQWFLFMDTDAIVVHWEWDLEHIKQQWNVTDDIHMVIEASPGSARQGLHYANSGVYLLRNSEIGRGIMTWWYRSIPKYPELWNNWPGDQGIFNNELPKHPVYGSHIRWSMEGNFANVAGCHPAFNGWGEGWIQHYIAITGRNNVTAYLSDLLGLNYTGQWHCQMPTVPKIGDL